MATTTDSLEDMSCLILHKKHVTIHKRIKRDSDSGAENDIIVHNQTLKVKRVKSGGTGIRRQSFIVKSKEMKAYFRLLGKWFSVLLLLIITSTRGAVVQWLARPLVTPAARVRAPDQAHY